MSGRSGRHGVVLAGALVACLAPTVRAQTGEPSGIYEAATTVPIANADQATAREKALSQALHDAVRGAVIDLVGEEEAAGRQAQIERSVLARSRSFVTGYQVVDEGAEGGAYRVAVQAHVAMDSVRRALDALDAPRFESSADSGASEASPGVESSADVFIRGDVTAARYRSIRLFLERQVPGVRAVSVRSLEPGSIGLRVRGGFPAHGLSGYLSQSNFGDFRLVVTPAELGPDLEIAVEDAEGPR